MLKHLLMQYLQSTEKKLLSLAKIGTGMCRIRVMQEQLPRGWGRFRGLSEVFGIIIVLILKSPSIPLFKGGSIIAKPKRAIS